MVLEQNAVPGLTNRMLARVVRAAAVTYDSTKTRSLAKRAFVSGNPVRAEFVDIAAGGKSYAGDRPAPEVELLIFGGSQGAHAINVAMVDAASALAEFGGALKTHSSDR